MYSVTHKEQNRASQHHAAAKDLAHGEVAENKAELCIRFPEELDEKSDHSIKRDKKRQENAASANPVFQGPQNDEEDNALEEELIEL